MPEGEIAVFLPPVAYRDSPSSDGAIEEDFLVACNEYALIHFIFVHRKGGFEV